jgi:hypothetical protein
MAFTLIGHASASSAGSTNTINSTGANLIVVFSAFDGTPTITDNYSNTWTPLTIQSGGAGNFGRFWYCYNPTVGAGHYFNTTTGYAALFAQAWSGATASPVDQQNGSYTNGSVTSPLQPGSVTPTTANQLIITGVTSAGAESGNNISLGFTITDNQNGVTGVTYGGSMAYLVQTSASAVNPTWTATSGGYGSSVIATFKSPIVAASILPSPVVLRQAVIRSNTF